MKPLILIAAAALGACSTTSAADLAKREGVEIAASSRTPEDIAGCLASTLGHLGAPAVYRQADRIAVSFTIDATVTALFLVSRDGTIQARRSSRIIPFRMKRAEGCLS